MPFECVVNERKVGVVMPVKRWILPISAVLLLGFGLVPLIALFFSSLHVDGAWSLERYFAVWSSPRLWLLLGRSVSLAGISTAAAALIGIPLGILFGKTDLPGRRWFAVGFALPLLLPPYFLALGWFGLLGREGWLIQFVPEPLVRILSEWLFGLPGCALTLFTVFLPLVILLTMVLLHRINPRTEEAARLYVSWPAVLCRITLPAILPGVAFGCLLVFLLALGELSVPMFLRYDVYPLEILTQFTAFYDFDAATVAAAPLVLVAGVLLVMDGYWLCKTVPDLRPTGVPLLICLGESKWRWAMGVSALLLILMILPFGVLMFHASIADIFDAWHRAGDALGRSLVYAAISASLLTAFGWLLGLLWNEHMQSVALTEFTALLTLILPGSVIGIALILLWNRPATAWIYASPALLLIGYVIRYAALSGGIVRNALTLLPPTLEQAAAVAGAGWWRRQTGIVLPLIRRELLIAWLIAYLFCLRDTDLAMLIYPPGGDTLPVRIFTLMANSPFGLVAALCCLLVAAVLPALVLAWLAHNRIRTL